MTIFERLGLTPDASNEEIAEHIALHDILCTDCPDDLDCSQCVKKLVLELLAAVEQREHEAGERAMWEKFCPFCPYYWHNEPIPHCAKLNGAPDFDACELRKGAKS